MIKRIQVIRYEMSSIMASCLLAFLFPISSVPAEKANLLPKIFKINALSDRDISSDDKNMQFLIDEITLE